jgi:hypothetical protein
MPKVRMFIETVNGFISAVSAGVYVYNTYIDVSQVIVCQCACVCLYVCMCVICMRSVSACGVYVCVYGCVCAYVCVMCVCVL